MSAREEDEKTLPAKEVVAEDFRFSRKPNGTGADVQKIEEAVKTLTLSPRKVLGESELISISYLPTPELPTDASPGPINLDSTTSPRKPSKPSSFDADSKDPIKKPLSPAKTLTARAPTPGSPNPPQQPSPSPHLPLTHRHCSKPSSSHPSPLPQISRPKRPQASISSLPPLPRPQPRAPTLKTRHHPAI